MTFQKFKESAQFFAILFAGFWGVYTFIYKDIIVPARRPPAVTLTAKIEELNRADGMILVRAQLVVANRGDAKVWVPTLWWNVYGVSYGREDRTASRFTTDVRPLLQRGDQSVSRFSNVRLVEIVAAGRVPNHEYWFQPNDEAIQEQLFFVPESQFDAVQVYFEANIFKSIDEFAPPRWELREDGLMPTLLLKQSGWEKDSSRVVPLAPETDRTHKQAVDRADAGHNVATASLWIRSVSKSLRP